MANGRVLCKNDFITLGGDLYGIAGSDTKLFAKLLGYYDASKLVDVSYYACRFHW
jgi:hypothetical protein